MVLHGKATVSRAGEAQWTLCAGQHVGEWVLAGGTPAPHVPSLTAATHCETVSLGALSLTHPPPPLPCASTAVSTLYSDEKVANRHVRDFGWEIAHAAVSRRPPIPLHTIVARAEGYTYAPRVWDLSIVQGPFYVAPCTNPSVTIRMFSIAVRCWVVQARHQAPRPTSSTETCARDGADEAAAAAVCAAGDGRVEARGFPWDHLPHTLAILNTPPSKRTSEQLHIVSQRLQRLPLFRRLPNVLRAHMVKHATLVRYGSLPNPNSHRRTCEELHRVYGSLQGAATHIESLAGGGAAMPRGRCC